MGKVPLDQLLILLSCYYMGYNKYVFFGVFLVLSYGLLAGQTFRRPGFHLPQHTRSLKIPVDIQHNVILIPVQINGSFEMNFILDTGVKSTILTEPFLSQFLHLDSLVTVKVRGLGEGNAIDASLAKNVTLGIPGLQAVGMQILVLPDGVISYSGMFGRPVYGIIGYDIFSEFVVEINYARKYITLYDPFSYKVKPKFEELPIVLRGGKPYINASLTDFRGKKITSQWLIDTGSSNAIALYDRSLPVPEPSIPAFLGKGLSGSVYGRMARANEFQLGSFVFQEVIAGYPDPSSLNMIEADSLWYGNIGSEVLSRFQVIFDYYRNRIYLRRIAGFNQPFEYNVSGLEITTEGDNFNKFIIAYVRPKSPASLADVRVGDEILSLNGFDVGSMDITTVYGTLLKRNGKIMVIRVRRGDSVFKKKFVLVPEI